jgi:hypothetical protein
VHLPFEILGRHLASSQPLPDFFVIIKRLNDFANERSVVHFLALPEGDIEEAFKILVLDHDEPKPVNAGVDCIMVHFLLNEFGNDGILLRFETSFFKELKKLQFRN